MKILIGSLLFATAIFINFSELNTSPPPTGGGSSRGKVKVESSHQEPIVSDRTYIYVLDNMIEVDLIKFKNAYVAVDCRVSRPKFNIPTITTKKKINFLTQPYFQNYEGTLIRIVIYVEEDEDQKRTLLGAKLPPTGNEGYKPGDPYGLDPDETKWFITFRGIDYIVEYDGPSDSALDVQLWNRKNIRPDEKTIIANWRHYHYLHFGTLYILVFKNRYNSIEGAALDPFWTYRPGEVQAHENPYAEYQRSHQINKQKYHPIEENPNPRENLHQNQVIAPQHDAHHQLNLNPHEHLHPNQILDQHHTQHYAHQNDFSPVPFDPSQHYTQQNRQSPAPFDPNSNSNYPPHHPPNA